jgi:hypothetical protein
VTPRRIARDRGEYAAHGGHPIDQRLGFRTIFDDEVSWDRPDSRASRLVVSEPNELDSRAGASREGCRPAP